MVLLFLTCRFYILLLRQVKEEIEVEWCEQLTKGCGSFMVPTLVNWGKQRCKRGRLSSS